MFAEQLRQLFSYGYWARDRLLAAAESLDAAQFVTPSSYGLPSIRAIFTHLYLAESLWRTRCQEGKTLDRLPVETDFPDLAALASALRAEETAMRAYLGQLTDAQLAGDVHYRTTQGKPHTQALGPILLHVANHGTQHRSELAVRLTELGHSPGDLDLIAYLRQL